MTTTKAAYVFAAIVPFGFVILACIGIAHVAIGGLRNRRRRAGSTADAKAPAVA